MIATLLEWISDFHLRLAISDLPSKQPSCPSDLIQEKCVKVCIPVCYNANESFVYTDLHAYCCIMLSYVRDFLQILPQLVEILKEVASHNSRFVLPCLQFMYWSLLHLDQGKGHQVPNFLNFAVYVYRDRCCIIYVVS